MIINRIVILILSAAASHAATPGLYGQELAVVVKRVVYPGQAISSGIIETIDASNCENCDPGYIRDPAALNGMIAAKTIMPGKLIFPDDAQMPALISPSQEVSVLFRAGDLHISMRGVPVAEAGVGEPVSVRNPVSGAVVSGIVQADGTVLVNPS